MAEQAPDVIAQCAVEIGLGVRVIVAIAQTAEQAQVVGQAQGVLHFEIVAGLAHALVDVAADRGRGTAEQLCPHGSGQRLFPGRTGREHSVGGVVLELLQIVAEPDHVERIEVPQLAQFRAEGDFRLAGAPDLLAFPVLGRTLQVEAVLGAEVEGPAQRAGIVAGLDVRAVVASCDLLVEHRGIAIGALVAAFLGRQLPGEAVAAVELLAGGQVEAVEPAAVAVIAAELVVIEAAVLQARE
ncbi:hypothetical protein D3C86_1530940 [compost metagenome]